MSNTLKRFEALYGRFSADRPGLPGHLRRQVYDRMFPVFQHETDNKKILRHFRRMFHPDRPDSVFTIQERHQVFITSDHIFKGKKL